MNFPKSLGRCESALKGDYPSPRLLAAWFFLIFSIHVALPPGPLPLAHYLPPGWVSLVFSKRLAVAPGRFPRSPSFSTPAALAIARQFAISECI